MRSLLFPLAIVADEVEVILLCSGLGDAQTLAVLPDIALLASDTVRAVIQVLAMDTTTRTVECPFLFGAQVFQLFLVLSNSFLELAFRPSGATFFDLLLFLCSPNKLLFSEDPLVFSILDALFSSHHPRLPVLFHLLLLLLFSKSSGKICSTLPLSLDGVVFALLSVHLVCYPGRAFSVSHLLHGQQLPLATFDLTTLSLFCGFDRWDDLIDKTLSQDLLVRISGPLEFADQLLIVCETDSDAFPLVSAESVYVCPNGCSFCYTIRLDWMLLGCLLVFCLRCF